MRLAGLPDFFIRAVYKKLNDSVKKINKSESKYEYDQRIYDDPIDAIHQRLHAGICDWKDIKFHDLAVDASSGNTRNFSSL